MANWDGGLNNGAFLRLGVDQISQDVAGNFSSDTWILVMARGSNTSSWTGGGIPWNVNIDGQGFSGTFSFDFRSADSVVIASGSFNKAHNADGTKSFAVSASIGSTGTAVGGPTSLGGTFTQSTIPRASTPTVSNGGWSDAGGTFTLTTNRAVGTFTHDVDYFFGSLSGRAMTNIGASGTWTVPLSFLNQMPNATVSYGTFRTYTYNGGSLVGTKDVTFGISASAAIVPTMTAVTHSEAVAGVSTVTGGPYVQNISKLNLNITGAAGVYGSTITGKKIELIGTTATSLPAVMGPLAVSGTVAIKGTVTDSRGRTVSQTVNVNVLPWAPPKINSVGIQRAFVGGAVNEEGTYIKVSLGLTVSSLMNTTERNAMGFRISSRKRGDTTWVVKVNNPSVVGLAYTNYVLIPGYPVTEAHEVLVEVYDKFETSAQVLTVATSRVFMHWGGANEGLGIGKFWERGQVDVLGEIYHRDGGIVQPSGMVVPFAGSTTPLGWILCDGGAYSRTTYALLFAAIGTQYGAGDGSTTFNVPNLKGRIPVGIDAAQTEFDTRGEIGGAKTHTLAINEMPSHNHNIVRGSNGQAMVEVATSGEGSATNRRVLADGTQQLTTQNAGSGAAHNNLQPYMALYYIIKA